MRTSTQFAPRALAHPRPTFAATMARDVLAGMSREQKSIPCTWLYDRKGSELFEKITAVSEYCPARTEFPILRSCAAEIGALAGLRASLIELGSGSSHTTPLLLVALDQPVCCVPIDISLAESVCALQARLPSLPIHRVAADLTQVGALLLHAEGEAGARRVVFLPGSTIGNLAPDAAADLLRPLAPLARTGGLLILGADATQDPALLLPAYNDAQGVTAAFNKNLLARMNRELAADFDIARLRHAARIDARQHRVEMHLVSCCEQWVQVAGECFRFNPCESIHTENAYKSGLLRIQAMARSAGWAQRHMGTDAHARFGVRVFECLE